MTFCLQSLDCSQQTKGRQLAAQAQVKGLALPLLGADRPHHGRSAASPENRLEGSRLQGELANAVVRWKTRSRLPERVKQEAVLGLADLDHDCDQQIGASLPAH